MKKIELGKTYGHVKVLNIQPVLGQLMWKCRCELCGEKILMFDYQLLDPNNYNKCNNCNRSK